MKGYTWIDFAVNLFIMDIIAIALYFYGNQLSKVTLIVSIATLLFLLIGFISVFLLIINGRNSRKFEVLFYLPLFSGLITGLIVYFITPNVSFNMYDWIALIVLIAIHSSLVIANLKEDRPFN